MQGRVSRALSVAASSLPLMDLTDAHTMGQTLLAEHGLDAAGWRVVFDGAKRRAGVCRFGPQEISLSAPITRLHDEAEVRDTILHEIAHALVGPRHGHDATWRRAARQIGCSGLRCTPADAPRVEPPWLGVCAAGHTTGRHRRPERVMTCAACSRRFDLTHLVTWTYRGLPAPMHPNYDAELARLRSGELTVLLPVGAAVRVTAAGDHHGTEARVVKRGRTRYHLRVGRQVLTVPFAWVEPLAPVGRGR